MIFIIENIAGIFALDENNQIRAKVLFKKDSAVIAEYLYQIQQGNLIEHHYTLIDELGLSDVDIISVEDQNIALKLKENDIKTVVQSPSAGGKYLRKNLVNMLTELKYIKNQQQFQYLVNEVNSILTRKKIGSASEKKDKILCQSIETIDNIDKCVNIFSERLREWYGLHFPELDKLISNHLTYARIISKIGKRDNYNLEILKSLNLPEDKANQILESAKKSMGANLQDSDMIPLMEYANIIKQIYEFRDKLANYLTDGMNEIAPNLSTLVGPLLAARLISMVGGLDELAKKPSSTIQIMGAEQALFRSIRTGAKPPKHGIIFQWEYIHGSPWWIRGKISRALAGKLSIASRLDAYSSEDLGDKLLTDLKTRIEEIKEQFPKPKRKQKKPKYRKDVKRSRRRKNRPKKQR